MSSVCVFFGAFSQRFGMVDGLLVACGAGVFQVMLHRLAVLRGGVAVVCGGLCHVTMF